MSEVGEVLQLRPEQEEKLSQAELKVNVNELVKLFEAQFENSLVKKYGRPGPAKVIPKGGVESAGYRDPRILVYAPPTEYEQYRNESSWKVDKSEENTLEINRGKGGIHETLIIATGDSPSVQYEFKDMHYDKEKPKQPGKKSQNTQATIEIAKKIIASMPQVKN
jgi:hypothetical protein